MNTPYKIQYLGHSAFIVETEKYYLFFDCQDENAADIDFKQFSGKRAGLFFSHDHHDHYSGKLHKQSAEYPNVFTALGGFDMPLTPETHNIPPRESRNIGGLTVYTAASADKGVCFIVQADGVNIYFAGDNADWGDGDPNNRIFKGEIDYLAGLNINIGPAFIPVCTYSGHRPKEMTDSAFYTIDKLKPAEICPMHANGREYLYDEFEKDLRASGRQTPVARYK